MKGKKNNKKNIFVKKNICLKMKEGNFLIKRYFNMNIPDETGRYDF